MGKQLDEHDGYEALQAHLVTKAREAREKYGPDLGPDELSSLLGDSGFVRFPTELRFGAEALRPGEFAFPEARGEEPADGYTLWVHPHFEERPEALPLLVAYHVPSINYLDLAREEEAELYGSTLLGLEREDYYRRLCALADELAPPPGDGRDGSARLPA